MFLKVFRNEEWIALRLAEIRRVRVIEVDGGFEVRVQVWHGPERIEEHKISKHMTVAAADYAGSQILKDIEEDALAHRGNLPR